jgi:type II secretory pathway component GspD/PulD (secretin)
MTPSNFEKARRSLRVACILAGAALLLGGAAYAQNPDHPQPPPEPGQVQTFFLKNVRDNRQLNDVQTALRNMLPRAGFYGIASENAIVVRGTEEQLAAAQKLIAELDRPMQVYRVTYTITDLDNGRPAGSHSVSVLVPANSRSTLKLGSKVPILTGSISEGSGAGATNEFQYQDVGLLLEANASGAELHTKLDQTAVSTEKSNVGIQDPVISQTILEGESPLGNAKPVVLGTMDVPNSTRQQQISVSTELVSGGSE